MKLAIDPKKLATEIAWAARAIPARPTAPVLAGLLLQADHDQLTISAFDYDTSVRTHLPADVAEPGRTLLPGRLLAEIAKSLHDAKVYAELSCTDTEATLTCGTTEFNLLTLPADDYPDLPAAPQALGSIDATTFAAAVQQVHVAATNDDTLPMLTGIRVDIDGDQVALAATDRYRIAARNFTWEPHTSAPAAALIPARHLHDLTRHLTGTLHLGFDGKVAAITTDHRQATVRILDEQFIDYNARLAGDHPITAQVDAHTLADAIKRVTLVAERVSAVRLSFTTDQVLVRAGGGDLGRGAQTVPCTLDGDPIDIAFQSTYLLDALAGVDGQATIGMHTPAKPALIASEDGSYRHLVMSLRMST